MSHSWAFSLWLTRGLCFIASGIIYKMQLEGGGGEVTMLTTGLGQNGDTVSSRTTTTTYYHHIFPQNVENTWDITNKGIQK